LTTPKGYAGAIAPPLYYTYALTIKSRYPPLTPWWPEYRGYYSVEMAINPLAIA